MDSGNPNNFNKESRDAYERDMQSIVLRNLERESEAYRLMRHAMEVSRDKWRERAEKAESAAQYAYSFLMDGTHDDLDSHKAEVRARLRAVLPPEGD
jgi:hypothetical protein